MSNAPLLACAGVSKTYPTEPEPTQVLRGIDLEVAQGEAVAVVGPSGCGKSTLLNLIGALDAPTEGVIRFDGTPLPDHASNDAARFRNREMGFVLQSHHLLPQCTAIENVLVPTLVNPDRTDKTGRAKALLDRVGLGARMDRFPGQLSGGECQRVAVVRALINGPRLLLADEPTGSLNESASQALTELLLELNREEGMALIVVTHAMALAEAMEKIYTLHEGRLEAGKGAV